MSWVNLHEATVGEFNVEPLSITGGGTGSTDAANAREALGITPANIGAATANHTHSFLYSIDTRNDNLYPIDYVVAYGMGIVIEFKYCSVVGLPSGTGTYTQVVTHIPWNDKSGGYPKQMAICGGKLYTREGTADTTWSSWYSN